MQWSYKPIVFERSVLYYYCCYIMCCFVKQFTLNGGQVQFFKFIRLDGGSQINCRASELVIKKILLSRCEVLFFLYNESSSQCEMLNAYKYPFSEKKTCCFSLCHYRIIYTLHKNLQIPSFSVSAPLVPFSPSPNVNLIQFFYHIAPRLVVVHAFSTQTQ